MNTNHPFTNILEYIPSRYVGLSEKQLKDRRSVWNFKDGKCPLEMKRAILSNVLARISNYPSSSYVVCFVPASTKEKTERRYTNLAVYLKENLNCDVCEDAISVAYDTQSGYLTGKSDEPEKNMLFDTNTFFGKDVILIDDVITRGKTFNKVADKLEALGAKSVYGLFVARTIHPNLPVDNTQKMINSVDDYYIDTYGLDLSDIGCMSVDEQIEAEGLDRSDVGIESVEEQLFDLGLDWSDIM